MVVGGPTQVPVLAVPHDSEGKAAFEISRRYDLTLKGFLGILVLGAILTLFILLLRRDYWYVGVALMLLAAVFFSWSLIWNGSRRQ